MLKYEESEKIHKSPYYIFIIFFILSFIVLYPPNYKFIIKESNSELMACVLVCMIFSCFVFIYSAYELWSLEYSDNLIIQ
jgi:amino acid transporter